MGYVCADIEFPIVTDAGKDWVDINKAIKIVNKGLNKVNKVLTKKYKHLEHIVVKDSL